MTRFSGCLSDLPPQAEHLLLLRAGVGLPRPYSSAQVAGLLRLTAREELRAENQALSELQGAARSGGCPISSSVSIQVPAQDHLVASSPALSPSSPSPSPSSAVAGASSGADSSSGSRTGRQAVSAAQAVRPSAPNTLLDSAVRLSTSTPTVWFLLAALALLASLAVLSAVGRRMAARQPVMMAATAGPALGALRPSAPVAEASPSAAPPVADPAGAGVGQDTGAQTAAEGAVAPQSAAIPTVVPVRPVQSDALSSPGVPAAGAAPNRTWLQSHRTHVALGLTALAGGATRLLARRRR